MSSVPVIDVGVKDLASPPSIQDEVAVSICRALKEYGAMYLVNHGIPDHVIKSTYEVSKTFFGLPREVKTKNKIYTPETIEGYNPYGAQRIDEEKEEECREAYDILLGGGTYPQEPTSFQPVVKDMIDHLISLSMHTLQHIGKGLGLAKEVFTDAHKSIREKGKVSTVRISHYPPIKGEIENKIRCGAHTDYGSITLLLPDQQGLMIRTDQSQDWRAVTPVPGAILVIVGDLLEVWSGGELRATEHMVPAPEDPEIRGRSRYVIILFTNPDDDTMITPLVGDKHQYKPVNSTQHFLRKIKQTY